MSDYYCDSCGMPVGVGMAHVCDPGDVNSFRRNRAFDHLAASAPSQCPKCYRLLSPGHVCDQSEVELAESMEREARKREANSMWTAFHFLSELSWGVESQKREGFMEAMTRLRDQARELEAG